MNPKREYYKNLINNLFGDGVCNIDTESEASNNVLGALVSDQFDEFSSNFKARLERISKEYASESMLRSSIDQALNQVADKNNWDGAYSEISVLDFLFTFNETSSGHIRLDVTLPATETLASELGYLNSNLDGYLTKYEVYFDTKVLSDKSGQILKGIVDQVLKIKEIKRLTVLPAYNIDAAFDVFSDSRKDLVEELARKLDVNSRPTHIKSDVVENLSYEIAWDPRVVVGESEYNPLEHGNNHHHLIFQHTKKFHRTKPTILFFVNFPWFGEKVPPFAGVKESYYRNLCSSFFGGYSEKTVAGSEINQKIRSGMTAHEVTKYLSGIIFIDDHSVTGDTQKPNKLAAFSYINPNAINSLDSTEFSSFLYENTKCLNQD